MHSQKQDRIPLVSTPPGLHLQIPLDIPDRWRRPKIKPRRTNAMLYLNREKAQPKILTETTRGGLETKL